MKNTLSKIILAVNIGTTALLFVLNYFYQINNFDFTLKCVCSSLFTGIGIVNLAYALGTKQKEKSFYISMAVALVFSLLGDIFIYYSFIAGAATFAISHICFIITYCFIEKIKRLDLIIGAIFFAGAASFLLCPLVSFEEAIFKPVCIAYALIISLMVGKAMGNYLRNRNIVNAVIAIASVLFFISDIMLVIQLFTEMWDYANNACMAMYYPALCIFAFSMYLKICKSNIKQ